MYPDKKSRLLDIGAGYGFLLNELHKNGYKNIVGIEISGERRNIALEHCPVEIMALDVNRPNTDIGDFNVVTLFHVLEHVSQPVDFLKCIRKFIKPGGVLICEVPNVEELLLEECEQYNDFYWIRAHLSYFSQKTILECLRKAQYRHVEVQFEQRYGVMNLCNWLSYGTPQIEKPVFTINARYSWIEEAYRKEVKRIGKSDTIIALARK